MSIALASSAAAQVGAPVRLVPSTPPAGASVAPPSMPGGPAAPTMEQSDDIKATPLAPVDPDWMGTLGDSDRPLPQTMWQGTSRSFVGTALPQLSATTSPSLQALARRFLLSNAAAPSGRAAPDEPNLVEQRIDRLVALGQIESALALVDVLPRTARTEALDRRHVELLFAANDGDRACKEVQDAVPRYQSPWWDRALIACEALAGDREKVSLGQTLLREQQAPHDGIFDALIDAVAGRKTKLDKLPNPTPMQLALLAAAKLPLPADALASADPAALRAWAGAEAVPAVQRLAAAERATALGALSPAALGTLYAKVEFKPEEEGAALKEKKLPDGAKGRALLFTIAHTEQQPAARAKAIEAFLSDGRKRGDFITAARVTAPLVLELRPSADLDWFAADAARALFVAGRADAAYAWLSVSDDSRRALFPIVRLTQAGGDTEGDAAALHEAITMMEKRDAAAAVHQATLMLVLLTALDAPVNAADWAPLFARPRNAAVPNAALWVEQEQASAAKRIGETVLTSLLLAQAGDHLTAEPVALDRVIRGLRAVGLDADARALAVEAGVAAGI